MLPHSHPYNPSMEMYHLLLPLQPHSCLLSGAGCVSNSSVPPECHLQHSQLEGSFFSEQTRLELNGNDQHFLDHAAMQDFATPTPVQMNHKFANLRPIIVSKNHDLRRPYFCTKTFQLINIFKTDNCSFILCNVQRLSIYPLICKSMDQSPLLT